MGLLGLRDDVRAYRARRPEGEETRVVVHPTRRTVISLALVDFTGLTVSASPLVPRDACYLMPEPGGLADALSPVLRVWP